MDSITQFALGSSVALAGMSRRNVSRHTAWKIALIGGMVGTLPDLDAFIDFGDAISNMIRHRAETHGLFYLALASPLIGYLIAQLLDDRASFRRWSLIAGLILFTHVGIDWLTIYGTQLGQPFSDTPFGLGSLFVIDPLYTVPLIVGILGATLLSRPTRWRWNTAGLVLSTAYIVWSLGMHQHAVQLARQHPPAGDQPMQLLVTAAPFNTLLWRAVAITPTTYYEGWYSIRDPEPRFTWQAHPRNSDLIERYRDLYDVQRVTAFSHGFFKLDKEQGRLFITDLRLGLEPFYSFRFDLGSPETGHPARSERLGVRPNLESGLPWLWHRMKGNPVTLSDYMRGHRGG